MHKHLTGFRKNIADARHHSILFEYLERSVRVPVSFDDLLRSQIAQVSSAFDKLLHDIITTGMSQMYSGTRPVTAKFNNEAITIKLHLSLVDAVVPPRELVFEQAMMAKLGVLSFQHPDKISEGLSFIWGESDKWKAISIAMGLRRDDVRTRMALISSRRNAIVHESDVDPTTGDKVAITVAECEDITAFVERCGCEIVALVV